MGKKPVLKWTSLVLAGLICGCQNSSPRPDRPPGGMAQKGVNPNGGFAKQNPSLQTPTFTDQNPYARPQQGPTGQQPFSPGGQNFGNPALQQPLQQPGIAPPQGISHHGPSGALNLPPPNQTRLTVTPHSPAPVSTMQPGYSHSMPPDATLDTRLPYDDPAPALAQPRFGPPPSTQAPSTHPSPIVIPPQGPGLASPPTLQPPPR